MDFFEQTWVVGVIAIQTNDILGSHLFPQLRWIQAPPSSKNGLDCLGCHARSQKLSQAGGVPSCFEAAEMFLDQSQSFSSDLWELIERVRVYFFLLLHKKIPNLPRNKNTPRGGM